MSYHTIIWSYIRNDEVDWHLSPSIMYVVLVLSMNLVCGDIMNPNRIRIAQQSMYTDPNSKHRYSGTVLWDYSSGESEQQNIILHITQVIPVWWVDYHSERSMNVRRVDRLGIVVRCFEICTENVGNARFQTFKALKRLKLNSERTNRAREDWSNPARTYL